MRITQMIGPSGLWRLTSEYEKAPTLCSKNMRLELVDKNYGGQGRDRTGDLPLFRRTLVPTELPGRTAPEPNAYRIALFSTD